MLWKKFTYWLSIPIGAVLIFYIFIDPWQSNWGATQIEIERAMPGDDLISEPGISFTRAITISAPPEEIWPWLLQYGEQRAGFYGYDWFDNRGIRSSEEIIDEYQDLAVGDDVPISAIVTYIVDSMDENSSMVWKSSAEDITGSWSWGLYALNDHETRLITRLRGFRDWTAPSILFEKFIDAFDIGFMRKSLLGIKQRAEGDITDSYIEDLGEGILWFLSFGQFAAISIFIFRRDHWFGFWQIGVLVAGSFLVIYYLRPPQVIGWLFVLISLFALIKLAFVEPRSSN